MEIPPNPYASPSFAAAGIVQTNLVYEDASRSQRFVNFIIDQVAVRVLRFALAGPIVEAASSISSDGTPSFLVMFLAMIVVFLAYYAGMEALFGRTLGKLITGTKVVDDYDEKPGSSRILIRSLCRLIPFEQFSFFGERGWHDSLSGTRVVRARAVAV